MKIKYIFSPEDFKGFGQMIVRQSAPIDSADFGSVASVAYKVGWINGTKTPSPICLISLTDGMSIEYESMEKLCEILNNDDYGYRPMSLTEMIGVMKCQDNRFA